MGLITFIRQHIRHFSDLTAEFESLKRSSGPIEWTPQRLYNLQLLQQAIKHAPLLIFPDFSKPFYIATDASCLGIGGVLYQPSESDNEDITGNNIIAICSKKLNECQQRYSTYKKELFAIIYCLRQFHSYIWGYKFVLITDHLPLVYLLTSSRLAHALQQWLDVILDYSFIIKHRPGVLHVLPDSLSRLYELNYIDTWGVPSKDPYEIIQQNGLTIDKDVLLQITQPPPLMESVPSTAGSRPTYSRKVASASPHNSPNIQIELTMTDVNDEPHDWLSSQATPRQASAGAASVSQSPSTVDSSGDTDDEMEHKYDVPKTKSMDADTVIAEPVRPPISLDELKVVAAMEYRGKSAPSSQQQKNQLIMNEHAQGHFGREAIFRSLYKKGYWWPGIRQHIQEQIRKCVPCLRHVISKTGFDPSTPITAALPFDQVQIDFIVQLIASTPDGFTVSWYWWMYALVSSYYALSSTLKQKRWRLYYGISSMISVSRVYYNLTMILHSHLLSSKRWHASPVSTIASLHLTIHAQTARWSETLVLSKRLLKNI